MTRRTHRRRPRRPAPDAEAGDPAAGRGRRLLELLRRAQGPAHAAGHGDDQAAARGHRRPAVGARCSSSRSSRW